jgi:hypothetical protein
MGIRNLIARGLRKATLLLEPPARQIRISDDFLKWLCFANAGMLDPGNLYLMDYALARIRSEAPLVEIGSFCGLSANVLTHYKRKHKIPNRLITCDRWSFANDEGSRVHVGESPVLFSDYQVFVREAYVRNTRMFSSNDLPFTVEATSDELFEMWRERKQTQDVFGRLITLGGPISFCYVDGNHSYEGAKQDFIHCDSFLEKGGFLLFDDSVVEDFGVRLLMPEVITTGRYRLVAQNPNHLFEKVL